MAKPHADWSNDAQNGPVLALSGAWNAENAAEIEALIETLAAPAGGDDKVGRSRSGPVTIDCEKLSAFDTLGGYLIRRLSEKLEPDGRARIVGLRQEEETLLEEIARTPVHPAAPVPLGNAYRMLSDIGEAVVASKRDLADGTAFLGSVILTFGRIFARRARLRPASIVTQMERIAVRGAPIIILISFLVGAIIAQQSIFQLQSFGTTHFVADLLGILILRELAVLLTAIMIAGRSGSSFTAELGSMKMREEIDALGTMGLDPMEVLVLPRIIALMLALPLLTFIASIAGIVGGAIVAYLYGGVGAEVFFSRLRNAIGFNTFMVGMIKAPFMALVIGMIACIEGFAVRGSAESLGQHTTASVVKSIFIVIVVDGLFAMFFAAIDY